ncbi:S-fimbrial adhesin protein SfaS [Klebsiella spallanzanii]|uniref:S-fimbrial adhesin protein SfaS n=1 Tax=Klebsiella spallanzanii TaxID=2587528 RepID=A0ABY6VIP3_9ENTR|nr:MULTISPECIES: type 1 fimbrial protein [Klebsiella]MBA7932195.1 type 1 fimbrial protein [Klebsiella sp. RHBSTW-00215]MDM4208903.1 type 1 fimbrial protein [Klebsiella spallanzanii]WEJ89515.1 MAG: type 1 fimbrial protein [Klebsiella huaxiensis]VUS90473.1 S-fimbrial adhesin protein SfaS [Klebsiella spallanzanii]
MQSVKIYNNLLVAFLFTFVSPVFSADVTITVNGSVVAKPCTVSTSDVTVYLGDLYTFNLLSAGSSSAWHEVSLNLTNCPVGTSAVTATFSGNADATGYYKNLGTATNIQLQLQDSSGNDLNNGTKTQVSVDDSTLSASFPLQVRALSVNGGATQGSIESVISVTYTYQ